MPGALAEERRMHSSEPPTPQPAAAEGSRGRAAGRRLSARAKAGLAALALVLVLGTAYAALWLALAHELRLRFESWAEERRDAGYVLSHSRLHASGFPFVVRLSAESPSLGRAGRHFGWTWSSAKLEVETRPWRPDRLLFKLKGPHRLATETQAGASVFAGAAEAMQATVFLGGGAWKRAEALVEGFRMSGGEPAFAVERWRASARRLDGGGLQGPSLRVETEAAGVRVPEAIPLPLGHDVRMLGLTASLVGDIPDGAFPEALAAWRDAGGTLEVERLALAYGPLALEASGTVAVDKELQPMAAFAAKAEGFQETIDALRARGLVRGGAARTAQLVLGALARRPEGGGKPVLEAALTVQDRRLYVGPVVLAEVPAIPWR
jgi:hypothetical protein